MSKRPKGNFWENTRLKLTEVKPPFFLAEAWEPALMERAFDAAYGWDFHHLMNKVAQGKANANELTAYFAKADTMYAPDDILMHFITNHDENSWNGTEYERMGDAVPCFAAMSFLVNGLPLLYSGQEAALKHRLRFFDKDTISWSDTTLFAFYRRLTTLKHTHSALTTGAESASVKAVALANGKVLHLVREGKNATLNAHFCLSPTGTSVPIKTENTIPQSLTNNGPAKVSADSIILAPWEVVIW